MRQIITLSFLVFMLPVQMLMAQTSYLFSQVDTVVVRFNLDTFNLAWAGGINYGQFSNIDLNGDGIKDLFVFDRTGNKPLCFVHRGLANSTEYRHEPEYELAFPAMQAWALLKDYNGDGKEDLWTYTPGGIKLYTNTTPVGGPLSFQLFIPLIRSNQLGNMINLYVSSVDLPGIVDIDGDGDLDVLTFGVIGTSLEYHRNYSVENGHGLDSMHFQLKNQCWGCFEEGTFTNEIFLNSPCPNSGIPSPELPLLIEEATRLDKEHLIDPDRSAMRHSGSCTCGLDLNGDKMIDLLLGDVSFPNLVQVTNGATVVNANQCMNAFDTLFPSYDVTVKLEVFPCGFYVDVNNDSHRDLIVTPQSTGAAENKSSVLYYKNTAHDTLPVFDQIQRDFLQKEMIEKGEGAIPVFADYDGDGLMDLFVSSFGYFDPVSDSIICKVSLYRNVGTATRPEYNFLTDNFEGLNSVIGQRSLVPTFGDLDGDGDDDMIVGDETGVLARFVNTAGPGNPYDFILVSAGMLDNNGVLIDAGQFSAPVLVDIDRDSDLDILVGNRTGKISFYENIGTTTLASFRLVTVSFGNLNVKEWWDNSGFSMPSVYDDNGSYQLFVGSKAGWVHHYNNIDGNLSGSFTWVDSTVFEIPSGLRTAPAVADLNNDGFMDMILGNFRGGLSFFVGDPQGSSSVQEYANIDFSIYPNPVSDQLFIAISDYIPGYRIIIHDLTGRKLYSGAINADRTAIDVSSFVPGLYFISIFNGSKNTTQKFIRYESR
ncbi:MAG: T9SS type A sorting domain-containing protein [Flavobacteriales bacterium]